MRIATLNSVLGHSVMGHLVVAIPPLFGECIAWLLQGPAVAVGLTV